MSSQRNPSPHLSQQNLHDGAGDLAEAEEPILTCTIRFTPHLIIIILVQILAVIVLGMEGHAFQQDRKWNQVVKGQRTWPISTIHHHQFFEGKTLQLLVGRDDTLQSLLLRQSSFEKVYLTLMTLFLLVSIIQLVVTSLSYIESHSIIISVVYGALGIASLIGTSVIVHMVTNVYETNYRKGADILYKSDQIDLIGGGDTAKLLQLRMEEVTLGNILSLCAHVSKPRTEPLSSDIFKPCNEAAFKKRAGGQPLTLYLCNHNRQTNSNTTEAYSVGDLDVLGFCDNSDLRTAIYCLSFCTGWTLLACTCLNCFKETVFAECIPKEHPLNRQRLPD